MGADGVVFATPPQANVTVGPFLLDSHEVTVRRFRRWWDAGHPNSVTDVRYQGGRILTTRDPAREPTQRTGDPRCNWTSSPSSQELHPINCLTFWTALAFCVWDGGRIPTESEWEFAARWSPDRPTPRRYPWGNADPACDLVHADGCSGEDGALTLRVGRRPPSGGLFDLEGNVGEWTADSFEIFGPRALCWRGAPLNNPLCLINLQPHTIRGSSYATVRAAIHSAARVGGAWTAAEPTVGYRCAR
ncbi:MAG: SUMF1/EgtB/PvdO family nonheme iron enzyme [Deltaproteobacteria bacterium]|nr:SUMF1/EgtB/PvdO family nonheme iron enzyme [Deltaproteobacteria bacterium]